ncbi:radical SAM/SPASM domain-containing protein [Thermosipho melanesiensis]|nr:radical SAM protein [Thermosipho melanesiensis]
MRIMEFKLINRFGKKLLFLPNEILLFEIDNELFSLLYHRDTLPSFVKEEIYKQIPNNQKNNFAKSEKNFNIDAIVLTISHECNLQCKYCYGNSGTYNNAGIMDFKIAKMAIEKLFDKEQSNVGISFFGGEPLINFEVIRQVVKFAKKYLGKNVRFGITTNGTLINDDIASFLKNNDFNIMVSLDGNKLNNDKLRRTKNNEGTYTRIIEGIKTLTSHDINRRISVHATLTSVNNDLIELVKHFVNMNLLFTIQLVTEKELGLRPNLDKLSSTIDKYGKYIINLAKRKDYEKVFTQTFGWIKFTMDILRRRSKRFYPCGGGRRVLVVNPIGDVYICHRLDGSDNGKVGNIVKNTREEIIKNAERLFSNKIHEVDHLQDCVNCWAKYICAGRCYHESLIETNKWNSIDKYSCHFRKKLIELGLILYAHLPDELRNSFSKNNKIIN